MMYSLDEVGLIPAATSSIKHRADVNPFYGDKLPIFVAPMTCLINMDNWKQFKDSKVTPIYPIRDEEHISLEVGDWIALTINEFKDSFAAGNCPEDIREGGYKILIDCANGNMEELFSLVKNAKEKYGNKLVVMIGNIANPLTYLHCCRAGVDYVRVGIGGGSGCTTSVQTGIHASMPWILEGIAELKKWVPITKVELGTKSKISFESFLDCCKGAVRTKIVADGGITTISRAVKCLALGADYVMMGKVFAECVEAGDGKDSNYDTNWKKVDNHYYGQSSEQGQIDRFGRIKANPEGTDLWVPVTTNLAEFTTKFEAALRSAMSYCGAKTLNDFIGKVKYEYMSPDEFKAYNK